MIIHQITRTEDHPTYRSLEIQNLGRQYDFIRSSLLASLQLSWAGISHESLRALNHHAIACLHEHAGNYRPAGIEVTISESDHVPPGSAEVLGLMNGFVDMVNRSWTATDPILLSSYVLWRLNWIHPFVNGNGRTARAAAYYVLCLRIGAWLPGSRILPDLIRETRDRYVAALRDADIHAKAGQTDLSVMHAYLSDLLARQLSENGHAAPSASEDPVEPPPETPLQDDGLT